IKLNSTLEEKKKRRRDLILLNARNILAKRHALKLINQIDLEAYWLDQIEPILKKSNWKNNSCFLKLILINKIEAINKKYVIRHPHHYKLFMKEFGLAIIAYAKNLGYYGELNDVF